MDIARRLGEVAASAPLALMQKAAALKEKGRDVISLAAGEPDFDTPEPARRAAHLAIDGGKTHYTPCPGDKRLREALARKLERDNGLRCTWQDVIVSNGAKHSLFNAFVALLDPGDVVLIPAPYWVTYPEAAKLIGARPELLPTGAERGFKVDPGELDRALPGVRLFVFNSPSNPTGAVYSRAEIAALGEVLARHDCWIVTDEIYEKLVFEGAEHHSLPAVCPKLRDRTIVVNGLSKAYAMTGWRLGYATGPRKAVEAMDLVQSHTTSNACSISQEAAIAAVESDGAELRRMVEAFAKRRKLVLDRLSRIGSLKLVAPQGAFYVFPDASALFDGAIRSGADLCDRVLEETGVVLVAGDAFGDPRCFRLSYAASEAQITEALARLERMLTSTGAAPAAKRA